MQLGGLGERRKLYQWGLGQSPSRRRIWCIYKANIIALGVTFSWGLLRKKLNILQKLKQKDAKYTLEHEKQRQNMDFQTQKVGGQRTGFAHKD